MNLIQGLAARLDRSDLARRALLAGLTDDRPGRRDPGWPRHPTRASHGVREGLGQVPT
jgi:hypothetical protein